MRLKSSSPGLWRESATTCWGLSARCSLSMWQVAQARPLVWGSALSKWCLPALGLPSLTALCASSVGPSVLEVDEQAASMSAQTTVDEDRPVLSFMIDEYRPRRDGGNP